MPHRRGGTGGINVRKVFLEPRPLDRILWIQGLGTAPYAEDGPTVSPEVSARLAAAFGPRAPAFGLRFNRAPESAPGD